MAAFVTACSEIVVVAVGTVEFVVGRCKRLINQRCLTVRTLEALLVPVGIFIRQILNKQKHNNSFLIQEHYSIYIYISVYYQCISNHTTGCQYSSHFAVEVNHTVFYGNPKKCSDQCRDSIKPNVSSQDQIKAVTGK